MQSRPTSFAPFIGLSQGAHYCENGKFAITVNNKIDWLYREEQKGRRGDIARVPLLDGYSSTLLGIKLRQGVNNRIEDEETRRKIEANMKKITFKVMYEKGAGWVEGKS